MTPVSALTTISLGSMDLLYRLQFLSWNANIFVTQLTECHFRSVCEHIATVQVKYFDTRGHLTEVNN